MNNQRNVSAGTGAASPPVGVVCGGAVRAPPSPSQEGTLDPDADSGSPTRGSQRSEPLRTPGFLHRGDWSAGAGGGEVGGRPRRPGESRWAASLQGRHKLRTPAAHLNTPSRSSWGTLSGFKPHHPTYRLCHPGQVTSPLHVSVSS